MRVLFLNHNVVGSGTYFRAFHFARQLAARGDRVTLITTSRDSLFVPQAYERDGVEVIEAPDLLPGRARTGWDPYNTWRRSALVRQRAFDVVHAFDSRPAVIYPALSAAHRNNALFVMDWADWWGRGGWISERSGWFVRTIFGPIETWFEEAFRTRAHGMTVASRALADRSADLGVPRDRIEQLPHGCDTLPALTPRADARERLGLAADERIVLHVGVLTPGDHAFLRDAFARVQQVHAKTKLVLAGRTGMRVRAQDGVVVTREIDRDTLHAWLAAANVCVIPCRDTIGNRGRWPSKTNEYLSFGRCVVMPHVSDAADVVKNAGAGWTTGTTTAEFALGVCEALNDTHAADLAGERGRAVAQTELAWPRLGEKLRAFYERVGSAR